MEETNLLIFNSKPDLYSPLAWIFLILGFLGIPITFSLLIASLKLFLKPTLPRLKISFLILIMDFISCSMYLILGLTGLINGQFLVKSKVFCTITDILYMGSAYTSVWFVSLMGLERGLLIIHRISLPSKFWLIIMLLQTLYYCLASIILSILDQLGLVDLALYCMSTPSNVGGYIIICSYGVIMSFSFIITIYSYLGIAIIQRKRAWYDIRELNVDKNAALHQSTRTIIKVLSLLFLFMLGNTLELINTFSEMFSNSTRSAKMDFTSTCLMNLNPFINSILLLQLQRPVKLALLETFPFLTRIIGNGELNEIRENIAVRYEDNDIY